MSKKIPVFDCGHGANGGRMNPNNIPNVPI
jgi:hypothetical protein